MKILLINNHSILNAGDYAILLQTLRLLHQAFPDAEIVLTFNDPIPARAALPTYRIYSAPYAWGRQLVADRRILHQPKIVRAGYLLALLAGVLIVRQRTKPIRTFCNPEKQALIEELAAADLVVACGGGYLYHSFLFASALMVSAIIMQQPLVMLPQSIGPFYHSLQIQLARFILQRAALVFARESISWQRARDLGAAAVFCEPDLAFGFPAAPRSLAKAWLQQYLPRHLTTSMYVGITAMDWQQQNRRFAGQQRYEQELVAFINRLTTHNAIVVLFAQTCGPSRSEDDRYVNMRIIKHVRDPQRVIAIHEPIHPSLLQALYGCMDYFVATRLHSFIFATNAGVPAINIGYLTKSEGILRDMGMLDRWIDIERFDSERLWEIFLALQQESSQKTAQQYVNNAQIRHQKLQNILVKHFR
jgi:colanic acid/amylovoran biosynthesis protein